jgi:hypothetical protein
LVRLKPRKAGSFSKKGSRWQGIKAHIERKGSFEMAGLDIHGQPMNPDLDATYDLYKTYEIDFENSPSEYPSGWVARLSGADALQVKTTSSESGTKS